jgi:hypothetical protein
MIIRPHEIPVKRSTQFLTTELKLAVMEAAKSLGGSASCTLSSMWRVEFPGSDPEGSVERDQTKIAFCELVAELHDSL